MENLTYSNYKQFKRMFDEEMTRTAEGFVRIGYLLYYGSETNIVAEGGYESMNDFAKAEYGIDATQVSRFIKIYKRFGELGKPKLKEQYISHGVAKLGIMLTLPDYINEDISDGYSKSEINVLKKEIETEQKVSDIEVLLEEKDEVQQSLPEGLKQAVYQFVHDYPEEYQSIYKVIAIEDLKEIIAPAGESSYVVRIKGLGKLVIFFKAEEGIVITNVRSGNREEYEWSQFFDALKEYISMGDSAEESWSNVFGEEFPLNPHKDYVPQAKQAPENTLKKESKKVTKVKVPEPKPKKAPKENPKEPPKEPEPQLPGQDSILNHPEYLPDDKKEVLTGEVENLANTDNYNVQQSFEPDENTGRNADEIALVQEIADRICEYKEKLYAAVHSIPEKGEQNDWEAVIACATDIVLCAQKLKELKEKQ